MKKRIFMLCIILAIVLSNFAGVSPVSAGEVDSDGFTIFDEDGKLKNGLVITWYDAKRYDESGNLDVEKTMSAMKWLNRSVEIKKEIITTLDFNNYPVEEYTWCEITGYLHTGTKRLSSDYSLQLYNYNMGVENEILCYIEDTTVREEGAILDGKIDYGDFEDIDCSKVFTFSTDLPEYNTNSSEDNDADNNIYNKDGSIYNKNNSYDNNYFFLWLVKRNYTEKSMSFSLKYQWFYNLVKKDLYPAIPVTHFTRNLSVDDGTVRLGKNREYEFFDLSLYEYAFAALNHDSTCRLISEYKPFNFEEGFKTEGDLLVVRYKGDTSPGLNNKGVMEFYKTNKNNGLSMQRYSCFFRRAKLSTIMVVETEVTNSEHEKMVSIWDNRTKSYPEEKSILASGFDSELYDVEVIERPGNSSLGEKTETAEVKNYAKLDEFIFSGHEIKNMSFYEITGYLRVPWDGTIINNSGFNLVVETNAAIIVEVAGETVIDSWNMKDNIASLSSGHINAEAGMYLPIRITYGYLKSLTYSNDLYKGYTFDTFGKINFKISMKSGNSAIPLSFKEHLIYKLPFDALRGKIEIDDENNTFTINTGGCSDDFSEFEYGIAEFDGSVMTFPDKFHDIGGNTVHVGDVSGILVIREKGDKYDSILDTKIIPGGFTNGTGDTLLLKEEDLAPAKLRITGRAEDNISLSWTSSGGPLDVSYEIYRRLIKDLEYSYVSQPEKIGERRYHSYIDRDIEVDSVYEYCIKAVGKDGKSIESNKVRSDNPDLLIEAPGSIKLDSMESNEVLISWEHPGMNRAIKYIIYRKEKKPPKTSGGIKISSFETKMERVGETKAAVFKDEDVLAGGEYTYYIRAIDQRRRVSSLSEPFKVKVEDTIPPTAPTGLKVVSASDTEVSLSWKQSTDDVKVKKYNIYRRDIIKSSLSEEEKLPDAVSGYKKYIVSTEDTSFTDRDLQPAGDYIYSITAVDEAGNESESTVVHAKTKNVYLKHINLRVMKESDGAADMSGVDVPGKNSGSGLVVDNIRMEPEFVYSQNKYTAEVEHGTRYIDISAALADKSCRIYINGEYTQGLKTVRLDAGANKILIDVILGEEVLNLKTREREFKVLAKNTYELTVNVR